MSLQNQNAQGDRVYLRPLLTEDINERYLSWFRDKRVVEFLEARNLTATEVIDYIEKGKSSNSFFMYAICDKNSNDHIGNLKVGDIHARDRISDLVTVIGVSDYWGKGIATEAIKLGGALAFEKHDLRKLTGGMYSDNIGSIKCYTNAGWKIEAVLKGHYLREGIIQDRICVSCFNPKYFDVEKIKGIPIKEIIGMV